MQQPPQVEALGPAQDVTRRALAALVPAAMVLIPLFLAFVVASALSYAWVASRLPSVDELQERANAFRSTRIYDRDGHLLNETFDPDAGRRIPVSLEAMAPEVIEATIATEDANFYEHTGVDPVAVLRAMVYAVRERRVVSGASTIPQQLSKRLFLSPERTLRRKLKEVVLATEISRRYDKDQVLALYLNEIYYGNLSYGIRAAADTYFGKRPSELGLHEAALLAGLPQAPAYYDPYTRPERAKARQEVVLGLMVENGMIDQRTARMARALPLTYQPPSFVLEAPHFTLYVREQLEARYGPEALTSLGLEVTTTLDRPLQQLAETSVAEHVAQLTNAGRDAGNGALVALRQETGDIMAMVGSADFEDATIDGQVNMALAPRQPGSTMKPLAYLRALEGVVGEAWTPGTILADITEEFRDGAGRPYVPRNYDEQEHGLVTVQRALGNSYNIPAVRTARHIGVDELVRTAQRLGIGSLTRADYGLSLVLGAGEVPLLEMTSAFGVLGNQGVRVAPRTILRIVAADGSVLCGDEEDVPSCAAEADAPAASSAPVVDPVESFLITAMLSDPAARLPTFQGSMEHLSMADGRPAAVKTGTTDDFRDSLTIGYTPQLVTGVWVGNADRSPMNGVAGSTGAAPIWSRFMSAAHAETPVSAFEVPAGVTPHEVCADTGTLPSQACPQTRTLYFATDRPPLGPEHDLWQRVSLLDGQLAPEGAPACLIEERDFKVYPDEHRAWAEAHGIPQPPDEVAELRRVEPVVAIDRPRTGATVRGIVTVTGSADVTAFESWSLWYGETEAPRSYYGPLLGPETSPARQQVLGRVDLRGFPDGEYVLRLVARDRCGEERDARITIVVQNPTPTPTSTATASPSPSAIPTMEATLIAATSTPEPPKPTEAGATPTLAPRPTAPGAQSTSTATPPVPAVTAVLPAPTVAEPAP